MLASVVNSNRGARDAPSPLSMRTHSCAPRHARVVRVRSNASRLSSLVSSLLPSASTPSPRRVGRGRSKMSSGFFLVARSLAPLRQRRLRSSRLPVFRGSVRLGRSSAPFENPPRRRGPIRILSSCAAWGAHLVRQPKNFKTRGTSKSCRSATISPCLAENSNAWWLLCHLAERQMPIRSCSKRSPVLYVWLPRRAPRSSRPT